MENNVHVCTDLSGGVRVPSPRTRPLEKIKFNSVQSYQIHIQRIVYISSTTQLIIFGHFLLIFFLRGFSMRLILNYNCVQEFKIEELYNLKTN